MQLRVIPTGTYHMRSRTAASRKDLYTLIEGTLSQAFLICQFEVTQGEWERVMGPATIVHATARSHGVCSVSGGSSAVAGESTYQGGETPTDGSVGSIRTSRTGCGTVFDAVASVEGLSHRERDCNHMRSQRPDSLDLCPVANSDNGCSNVVNAGIGIAKRRFSRVDVGIGRFGAGLVAAASAAASGAESVMEN